MLVLVPVPIVYLGETDNKLAARSSYGTGYGLPVQPIAKFGVASPGFEFAQIEFQSGQGSRTNAGGSRDHSNRQAHGFEPPFWWRGAMGSARSLNDQDGL